MTAPLDIPWVAGLWADSPGFTPPADGASLPSMPTDLNHNVFTAGGAPKWVANIGATGRPAFGFPLNADHLVVTPTYTNANILTAVVVGLVNSSQGGDLIDGGSTARRMIDTIGPTWRLYAGGTILTGGAYDANIHMFLAEYNTAGTDTLSVDGTQIISGEAGSQTNGQLIIGSTANGQHFGSKVAFAGFIDRVLTSSEKAAMLSWYREHYLGIAPARTGRPKVWNGSSWVSKPAKVWNGSAWVEKPMFGSNGTSFIESK
jgi:hypothetical protein